MTSATSTKPKSAAVSESLRADILTGRLHPGERLGFAQLRDRFGASMGTLREALTALVDQGLVVSERQQGFRVVTISIEDLVELTEARREMEGLALTYAIRDGDVAWEAEVLATHHVLEHTPSYQEDDPGRFSDEWATAHAAFHNALLAGCGNRRILSAAMALRDAADLYRRWSVPLGNDRERDIPAEHAGLMQAALERNAELACERLAQHIQRTTDKLIPVLTEADN